MKLKDKGSFDEDIEQKFNFDWVLTQEWLSDYFMKLVLDPAYVPRRGGSFFFSGSGRVSKTAA